MMNNRQLAQALTMIADLSEIKGENVYKTLAYRKAADSLLNLGREARMNVPGSAEGNWRWRATRQMMAPGNFQWLRELTKSSNRFGLFQSPVWKRHHESRIEVTDESDSITS